MSDILLRIAILGIGAALFTVLTPNRYRQAGWIILAVSSVLAFTVSDAHIAFRLFHLGTVAVATAGFINGRRPGGETS
ncbi:hypothetical protein [Streptomyces parvus]|uniref:hypothetical protein n=1 Tax=Streptomyces parvus TaxID=66428 RepID=UPI0035E14955